MKSQKGMSYIMMLLCIVAIIALIGGIIYFTQKKYEEEKLETLKTDLITLQGKIRILSQEVNMKKEGISYMGKSVAENLEEESVKKLINEGVITSENGEYKEYYILEGEDFKALGLENYNLSKVIVNYTTCEIIYPEGFNINDKTYYTLSDLKNIQNEENNTQVNELISNEEQADTEETEQ